MILDDIVAKRKEQLARELTKIDRQTMRSLALQTKRSVLSFPDALRTGRLSIIAEVKKASPSKSVICADFHPVEQAVAYERAGADAISCLTEEHYFQGSSQYFRDIRAAVSIPMLRKDFIIDTYQIDEARVMGADAILLIAAILDAETMQQFYQYATKLGLHCLFEAHNEAEMQQILDCGAKICGINNRNLKTFQVDLATTQRLAAMVPKDCILVSESGMQSHEDLKTVRQYGADAVLIGETLMRSGNVATAMQTLRENL
ncbi:MAG: indole-3-glycerol phosphate synthase TrpC [Oscillospiraceae bacterium]|nr:indole-3-glycerol phosphate synthase TrpC [Oscillospiraceae bacterium]